MRKISILFFVFAVCFTVACSGGKKGGASSFDKALTLADIEPKFQLAEDAFNLVNEVAVAAGQPKMESPFEISDIGYNIIGNAAFDDFFKASAKLNGLIYICKKMVNNSTSQLKMFAMDKAADEALKDNIRELVGITPKEDWTFDQSMAVMKIAKEKGALHQREVEAIANMGVSMGVGVVSLGKAVKEAKDLLPKGQELLNKVTSVSPMKIGKATKGVKNSLSNLNEVVTSTPDLLKDMTKLITALGTMG